ncbi:MarR family transcriptional regulator, partial [Bacillus altitudinis]
NIFRSIYQKGHEKIKNSLQRLNDEEKEKVNEGLAILEKALRPERG